jgi:hypothetical protein
MAVKIRSATMRHKGAVKKRTQLKNRLGGMTAWTKQSKASQEFMAMRKPAGEKKGRQRFKGVRREN